MKTIAIFACVLSAFLLTILSSFAKDGDPYLTKTFTLNGRGDLSVETSGGSIEVTGHDGNEVEVNVYVKANGGWSLFGDDDDDLEEALQDYEIDIRQRGNQVLATAKRKSKGWNDNGLSISFEVAVPHDISCNLNTSGGSISVANVEGTHDINTSGGSISFDNMVGTTKAHTSGGGINIHQYQGKMEASTSGGSVEVTQSEGDIAVSTSGGGITLEDVSGSVEASTSGGSIKADIHQLGESLSLSTSGGSIKATLPEGKGIDLDLSGNRVNTELVNFTGKSEKDNIKGSINGGGIPVNMHTSGGSVTVEYQKAM